MAFWRDVFRAAGAKMSGEKFTDYAREEQERKRKQTLGKLAINQRAVALKRLLVSQEEKYRKDVEKARALGNTNYPEVIVEGGLLDGHDALLRYNMNGEQGKVEVFYGGANGKPLGDGHGHIVIKNNVVDYWREPRDENGVSNQLY